jgi:hypothetical protein
MYVYENRNPSNRRTGDCVIRAISKVMNMSWDDVAIDLSMMMVQKHDIISSNALWGEYLMLNGFKRGVLPECPNCLTLDEFCKMFPAGTYVACTGTHVVAVIDGNFYDTFDSSQEIITYYYERMR